MGRHFLLQGIFPAQGSNAGLLHCRQMLYHLRHQGSPSPTRRDTKTLATFVKRSMYYSYKQKIMEGFLKRWGPLAFSVLYSHCKVPFLCRALRTWVSTRTCLLSAPCNSARSLLLKSHVPRLHVSNIPIISIPSTPPPPAPVPLLCLSDYSHPPPCGQTWNTPGLLPVHPTHHHALTSTSHPPSPPHCHPWSGAPSPPHHLIASPGVCLSCLCLYSCLSQPLLHTSARAISPTCEYGRLIPLLQFL